MTKEQLSAVLDDIADRIDVGDSWEGSIAWEMPEVHDGDPGEVDFMVGGVYRIGNRDGSQGGMRMIGTVPPTDQSVMRPENPYALLDAIGAVLVAAPSHEDAIRAIRGLLRVTS